MTSAVHPWEKVMNQPIETIDSTRRLILKGATVLALLGFAGIRFDLTAAFAAANDKYPEDAFKQKSIDDTLKLLYGKSAEGFANPYFIARGAE